MLFYGALAEWRLKLIGQLRAARVNAVALFGVYGEALHAHLRRAKIILNVHVMPGFRMLEASAWRSCWPTATSSSQRPASTIPTKTGWCSLNATT